MCWAGLGMGRSPEAGHGDGQCAGTVSVLLLPHCVLLDEACPLSGLP